MGKSTRFLKKDDPPPPEVINLTLAPGTNRPFDYSALASAEKRAYSPRHIPTHKPKRSTMARELTAATFQKEVIHSPIPVVIDFYAEWCGPCQRMAPAYEALSKELAGTCSLVKVDVEEEEQIAIDHRILSMPTLVFYKNGTIVGTEVGYRTREELRTLIKKHCGV